MAETQRKVPARSAEMGQFTEVFSEEVIPESSGAGERGLSAGEAEGQRGKDSRCRGGLCRCLQGPGEAVDG